MVKKVDNFASIGKAVILQSLGLQKNYTEIEAETVEETDYNSAGCRDCKYRAYVSSFEPGSAPYDAAINICSNCSLRTTSSRTVYKKVYHNEKNRYGYKHMLKSNAIKLLLLFHFYSPDRFGIIKNISVKDLSDCLHCNIKTIKNNLEILSQYDYISYCYTQKHVINLCLTDYEKYFLPANKGGRGFFVMSYTLLQQILMLDNLVSLRIHLRQLIEIDNLNISAPYTAVSKTFTEMKLSLPQYCKPCVIRKSINNSNNIFNISFKDNIVRFEIKDAYNSRRQKNECYNNYINEFNHFMSDFNSEVYNKALNPAYTGTYIESFIPANSDADTLKLINFSELELEDLATLALTYSYDYVMTALQTIYKTYVLSEKKITNLGGLVRTIITSLQKTNNSSTAA